MTLGKRCLAESIGTFAIVFFGCGAVISLQAPMLQQTHVAVNLVFGSVVAVMILAFGHISGAHLNPAVTLGAASIKLFPWREVAPYVLSQCIGALVASLLHLGIMPSASRAVNFGSTSPQIGVLPSIALEGILTFFLMTVILMAAVDSRAKPGFGALAIGGTVIMCGLFAGPLTGNSLNPARSLGPAFLSGQYAGLPVYIVGPVAGSVAAALLYRALWMSEMSQNLENETR